VMSPHRMNTTDLRQRELRDELTPQYIETAREKVEASGKKFTRRHEREARNMASAEAVRRAFEEAKKPGGEFHDDPIWNSDHELYAAVQNLIDHGMLADDAV